MKLYKFKKNKMSGSYAIRIAFSLSALLILLISVFSCIATLFFSYQSDSLYTKLNLRSIEQLANFTDIHIFKNLDMLCEQLFSDNSDYAPAKKFFDNIDTMTYDEMDELRTDMKKYSQNYSFLNSMYLYNSRMDTFVSTTDGIVIDASDPRNQFSIENRFFSYLKSINNDFYVPQDDNIMLRDQDNQIIYVHYVSHSEQTSFLRDVSCVIMVIDVKNIIESLQPAEIPGIQSFAVIDDDKRALIHSDNFPGISEFEKNSSIDFSRIMDERNGTMSGSFLGKRASYIWAHSDTHNWNYLYILSFDDNVRNLAAVIAGIVLLALIICLIGGILIIHYSKRLYKPLDSAIKRATDSLETEEHSDDEIEVLNMLIDTFSQRSTEYNDISEKYSGLALHVLSSDIIKGYLSADTEIIFERLYAHGVDFSGRQFGYVLIEFNPKMLDTFSSVRSDFILYDVMDALMATFNCIVCISNGNLLEMIINSDDISYSGITDQLRSLIPEKLFINLYLCPAAPDITIIPQYHKKAVSVTKYSYIYGFDNNFDVMSLLEYDADNSVLSHKDSELIDTLLRDGNKERFSEECNRLLTDVKKDRHSYAYAQNVILRIFSILCHAARELSVGIEQDRAFDSLTNNGSFDSATIYLFQLADIIFDKLSAKDQDKKYDLINSIRSYIDNNISSDISLASVAQNFNISAGYLSKFFKDNTGNSFSKYIIEKKFEYAAKMLLEHPEKPVKEIAGEVGYFDTAYFSKQFKATFGVTPVQYRKVHQ